nr:MAG TPA: hypothetical protein [Caudoviricetes sp.]
MFKVCVNSCIMQEFFIFKKYILSKTFTNK